MKFKTKPKILFAESGDVMLAKDRLLHLQDLAKTLYEQRTEDIFTANEEATKLVFSVIFPTLSGHTIAQWIAGGGEETRAYYAMKNYVSDRDAPAEKLAQPTTGKKKPL